MARADIPLAGSAAGEFIALNVITDLFVATYNTVSEKVFLLSDDSGASWKPVRYDAETNMVTGSGALLYRGTTVLATGRVTF